MRSRPRGCPTLARSVSLASLATRASASAVGRRVRPAGVSRRMLPVRSNSCTPAAASRRDRARDRLAFDAPKRSDAARTPPASAICQNAKRSSKLISGCASFMVPPLPLSRSRNGVSREPETPLKYLSGGAPSARRTDRSASEGDDASVLVLHVHRHRWRLDPARGPALRQGGVSGDPRDPRPRGVRRRRQRRVAAPLWRPRPAGVRGVGPRRPVDRRALRDAPRLRSLRWRPHPLRGPPPTSVSAAR